MIRTISEPRHEVLIVSDQDLTTRELIALLKVDGRFVVLFADNGFDAGVLTRMHKPSVIVVSEAVRDIDLREVAHLLRTDPSFARLCLICLIGEGVSRIVGSDECLPLASEAGEMVSAILRCLRLEPRDPEP